MIYTKVTASRKDQENNCTKFCRTGNAWSRRMEADAVRDIENNLGKVMGWRGDPPHKLGLIARLKSFQSTFRLMGG